MSKRRLIEDWLPIAQIGIESLRERTPMTPFPAPNRLHVWFARRPLVASRAAILGSLLDAGANRAQFLYTLGIHGDAVASRLRIDRAKQSGERFEGDAYSYSRAFKYTPPPGQLPSATVLDPTAGGDSVPLESVRLDCQTVANDLNPVAALLLKTTVELPLQFGSPLFDRFETLAAEFVKRRDDALNEVIPTEPGENCIATNWLWARTVMCPYCGGVVPLSPNWKLSGSGHGVRLVPENGRVGFEIVERDKDHSPGTVKGGDGACPFPECRRTIDGDEIKAQAQAGHMGHQLYCVVYKQDRIKGYAKNGNPKIERVRGFRAPRREDDVEALVHRKLDEKMPLWRARDIAPNEEIPFGYETNIRWPLHKYGLSYWAQMFSPRQLYSHCTSVEVFHDIVHERVQCELDRAAMVYVALALDKLVNYNAIQVRWHSSREVVAGVFDRHDLSFKWTYAEIAPTIAGVGHDWAIEQTGKALRELIELVGQTTAGKLEFAAPRPKPSVRITCGSADALPLEDASVDCVVMDPPYYDNVMYAELSDFFYVWLKRTAGLLYPELFTGHLTDKDREAVANPARFVGEKGGAKNLAGRDYQRRMAAIFREQRRVLKPDGIMTVMFTHKASGAWDALAGGLIEGGFTITASWPVNTEAGGSMHIREKSAARSTIFLVCRVREADSAAAEPRYWEDVEPTVAALNATARAESKPLLTPIAALQGVRRFQVLPINLLHALSKITAPPFPNLAAFSATWAERRYIWVFDPIRSGPDPWLRLGSLTKRLDFHQKTLLSADLGVAVACYVMETYFPIAETADATTAVELKTKGACHMGRKWPDLICTEATGSKGYIVECKGSSSGRSEVKRQLAQGTRQVTAVRFARGTPTERFIIGTEIQEDRLKVHAIDPPDNGEEDEADQHADVSLDTADVRRISSARTLSYCGDYTGALELLAPFEWEEYPKLESVEAQLTEINVEAGSFVGLSDRWLTPTGKRVEVFRGLERRVRERLIGRPPAADNPQPLPPSDERGVHYQATSSTRDRVHEVVSTCVDGTILVVRLSDG